MSSVEEICYNNSISVLYTFLFPLCLLPGNHGSIYHRHCRKNKSKIYTLKHLGTNDSPFNNHYTWILFSLTDFKSSIVCNCMPNEKGFSLQSGITYWGYISQMPLRLIKTIQCISLEASLTLIIYVKQTKYLLCVNISGRIHKNLAMVVTSERGTLREK